VTPMPALPPPTMTTSNFSVLMGGVQSVDRLPGTKLN
jgi:hypothetical protein